MNRWERPGRIDIEAQASAAAYNWTGTIVYAADKASPVQLKGTTEEAVHLWVNDVLNKGHEKGVHYAPSALRLFVRGMGYDFDSDDYKNIVQHIASSLPDYIGDGGERVEVEEQKPEEPQQDERQEQPDWLQPVVRQPTLGEIGKNLPHQEDAGEIEL